MKDSVWLDKPVFIGGSGSSGSTLLRILLNRHPDVFCGQELSVFNKALFLDDFEWVKKNVDEIFNKGIRTDGYFRYYPVFQNLKSYALTEQKVKTWITQSKNTKDFFNRFMLHVLSVKEKKCFAEKTPSNVYTFSNLKELYPNGKFIHLYRDGRDVVCSLKKRGYNWFTASSMWLYNAGFAIQFRNWENYYELSYEKLVRSPEGELQKLCDFIGIKFESSMLNPESDAIRDKEDYLESWDQKPSSEINDKSVGSYKTNLDDLGESVFSNTVLTQHGLKNLGNTLHDIPELMNLLGYDFKPAKKAGLSARFQMLEERVRRKLQSVRRGEPNSHSFTKLRA